MRSLRLNLAPPLPRPAAWQVFWWRPCRVESLVLQAAQARGIMQRGLVRWPSLDGATVALRLRWLAARHCR